MSTNDRIDQYLQEHFEDYIETTSKLCAQPSVSARREGVLECADLVEELLNAHGLEVKRYETPGSPIFVGRAAGRSERTLLFYNHYDVQPPEPLELWTTPPYEPTVRDGKLFARGAKDDKGELVSRLAALDAVRAAHDGELPCGVLFVVEGEEEIGSPHIAQFVLDNLDELTCHAAIWEEGTVSNDDRVMNLIGKRGILGVELSVEVMARDAHSGGAHYLPNAAWRLVWALHTLKDQDERVLIRGFYEHALPISELDASLYDANEDTLLKNVAQIKTQYQVDSFLRGAEGMQVEKNVFEPTCTIEGITTGYQGEGMKTVIPARASAKLDFRLVPDQDPDDIYEKLCAHLKAQGFEDVRVTRKGSMWPAKADPADPFIKLTEDTALEVYGVPAMTLPMVGGSSPVYAFSQPLGIPFSTPGIGYPDSRTHAPDEHFRLDDFMRASRHIARILDRFADL